MIRQPKTRAALMRLVKPMLPIWSWYMRVSPRMINCREFNESIFDYTEDLLGDQETTLFERHMTVCPVCRNFMKTYTATFKTGKEFFPYENEEISSEMPKDLLNAIQDTPNG